MRDSQNLTRLPLLRGFGAPLPRFPGFPKPLLHRQRNERIALARRTRNGALDVEDDVEDADEENGAAARFVEEPGLPVVPVRGAVEGAEELVAAGESCEAFRDVLAGRLERIGGCAAVGAYIR